MRYTWNVAITIREIDEEKQTTKVVGVLEGWQLMDTTFNGIQDDVDDFVKEYTNE